MVRNDEMGGWVWPGSRNMYLKLFNSVELFLLRQLGAQLNVTICKSRNILLFMTVETIIRPVEKSFSDQLSIFIWCKFVGPDKLAPTVQFCCARQQRSSLSMETCICKVIFGCDNYRLSVLLTIESFIRIQNAINLAIIQLF